MTVLLIHHTKVKDMHGWATRWYREQKPEKEDRDHISVLDATL